MLVLLVLGVVGGALVVLGTPPVEARGRCICPMVYAPVICDGGKVFSNQCFANCRNAKNCVPLGTF